MAPWINVVFKMEPIAHNTHLCHPLCSFSFIASNLVAHILQQMTCIIIHNRIYMYKRENNATVIKSLVYYLKKDQK